MRVKKEQVKRSRYFEPGSSSPNKRVRVGEKQFNVESFEPVIGRNKRPHTLLLGTMPSITSHKVSQYYGHPSNAFWWIVGDAFKFRRGGMNIQCKWPFQFGFNKDGKPTKVQAPILQALRDTQRFDDELNGGPILSYKEQVNVLNDNGYALWDVCRKAEMKNSNDASIKNEIPNDIFKIVEKYETLNRIVFVSGQKSASIFKRANKHKLKCLQKGTKYHFVPGDKAAKAIFGSKFFDDQPTMRSKGVQTRTIFIFIPVSVSPAASGIPYKAKSNYWLEHIFKTKPLYK